MSFHKKVVLVGIFSLVIIIMVFTIMHITVISSLTHQPDTFWSYMWSFIEQCVGKSPILCYRLKLYSTAAYYKYTISHHGRLSHLIPWSIHPAQLFMNPEVYTARKQWFQQLVLAENEEGASV